MAEPIRDPGFEAQIDENPLDATTHLVYADWLDDHGEHDEAAFRRAMGEWVGSTPGVGTNPSSYSSHDWWAGGKLGYPNGVTLEHMDFPRQPGYPQSPRIDQTHPDHYPAAHRNRDEGDTPTGYAHIGFRNYRGMEEAMRRSFMTGRRTTPEQLTRRRLARRRYRM